MSETAFRAFGLVVGALVLITFAVLWTRNIRQSRAELGSEIELAANKKPYLSDAELEGPKLDRSLSFALVVLGLCSLSLPFYWLAEPGRQEGAIENWDATFARRGENLYTNGAQCVNCHASGGVGGVAAYVYQDADGQFIANAQWAAPALNNVLLRYSESEVEYILNFGRPGSPMAAWGTPGGGPLTSQQVGDDLMTYIRNFQVQSVDPIDIQAAGDETDPDDPESIAAQEEADAIIADIRAEIARSLEAGEFETEGEAVFNMGLFSGYAAGTYSCARCHTAGWSLGAEVMAQVGVDLLDPEYAGCAGGNPSGIGFSICDGATENHFPDDTWLMPDGSWPGEEMRGIGPDGEAGVFAMDGTLILLDDGGLPVDPTGEPYIILDTGDLADCGFVSALWADDNGDVYPYDPDVRLVVDDSANQFVEPPRFVPADGAEGVLTLADGRIGVGCETIEMPERTSMSMYEFVYNGADAGRGYGRGGQSGQGMMPGYGSMLPPDLIQAAIDYVRGL